MYYSVTSVTPLDGYRLALTFEDGRSGVFDMSRYLDMPVYRRLASKALFKRAFVDVGTVAWPGDIDIAPECLWEECVPVPEAVAA